MSVSEFQPHAQLLLALGERRLAPEGDPVTGGAVGGDSILGSNPNGDHPGGNGHGPLTDEQLLQGFLQGNQGNFEKLVHRYERELFHFLFRFVGDRAAAEDVFQETFLQVYQSAGQFDSHRRFRPWVFTIAANKARDYMRSQARRHTSPLEAAINRGDEEGGHFVDLVQAADNLPDIALERDELQKLVQKTVGNLPEHLREVILLAYFHQFPYRQISEMLNIPLGTVKSRLHAAVAAFAERWREISKNKRGG